MADYKREAGPRAPFHLNCEECGAEFWQPGVRLGRGGAMRPRRFCQPLCENRHKWRKRAGLPDDHTFRPYGVGRKPKKSYAVWPCACLECGTPLPSDGKHRITCSQRCKDKVQLRRRPTAPCEICGEQFPLRNGKDHANRFCSYACAAVGYSYTNGNAEPRLSASTPLAYYSCAMCRSCHVYDARRARNRSHKPPCCRHLCPCGAPTYAKGGSAYCWPCHYAKYRDSFDRASHKRRAALQDGRRMDGDITRTALAERDHWRCHLCGKKVRPSTRKRDPLGPSIDHLIPVDLGGTHTWDNVALAHERCNLSKGTRAMGEQLMLIG